MKQHIISSANTVLLCIFIFTVVIVEFFKVTPPRFNNREMSAQVLPESSGSPQVRQVLPISQIYGKKNIFGLDWEASQTTDKFEIAPSPEFTELNLPDKPVLEAAPAKENFIDPLNISINGIITSSSEENNACIISESSGEEKMYKVGETVQDATILNININSVSFIRPNGQIETFNVGISEQPGGQNPHDSAVTKLEDNKYLVDPTNFGRCINSLGQMFEELGIVPAYKDELSQGLLVTKIAQDSLGKKLGLEENDILTAIDKIPLTTTQDRINAYDKVMRLNYNESFDLEIERAQNKISINYKLEKYKPQTKSAELPSGDGKSKDPSSSGEKPNTIAPADKNVFTFTKPAEDKERYSNNINVIRKRLLENARNQRISHLR